VRLALKCRSWNDIISVLRLLNYVDYFVVMASYFNQLLLVVTFACLA
jgi:hypothetical protein